MPPDTPENPYLTRGAWPRIRQAAFRLGPLPKTAQAPPGAGILNGGPLAPQAIRPTPQPAPDQTAPRVFRPAPVPDQTTPPAIRVPTAREPDARAEVEWPPETEPPEAYEPVTLAYPSVLARTSGGPVPGTRPYSPLPLIGALVVLALGVGAFGYALQQLAAVTVPIPVLFDAPAAAPKPATHP